VDEHAPGHGPSIAKGVGLDEMMAEIFARAPGCAGQGGSMHIADVGRACSAPTHRRGGIRWQSALRSRQGAQDRRVAVAFFGDGATNRARFTRA